MNTEQTIESNLTMTRFMTVGMNTKLVNDIVFPADVAKFSENNTIESEYNHYSIFIKLD